MTPATRGYALPLVLVLLLLLASLLTTVIFGLEGDIRAGESALTRRQAFHLTEGVQVAAVELAAAKLRTLPIAPDLPPGDPGFPAAQATMLASQQVEVQTSVNDTLSTMSFEGYRVPPVTIDDLQAVRQTTIGAGPFAGMLAQVQRFGVSVEGIRDHSRSPASTALVAEVERATISMFQFYVFADGYLDLDPGGPVTATGRIHTNGDFCIAGQPVVDTVTSAGRILMSNPNSHGLCRRRAGEANTIKVATDADFSTFSVLTIDHTHPSWSGVRTSFNGHLLDKTHNVGALKMPVSGRPRVQAGASVLAMEQSTNPDRPHPNAKEDNTSSMRFLVDPLLSVEPDDVKRQKFAFKADLRIVDGVWFLRDPANPAAMGTPIWSDHSGSMSGLEHYPGFPGEGGASALGRTPARFVGQENLRADLSWGTATPQRFSPYGFAEDSGSSRWTFDGTKSPVLSYGVLHNAGGNVFAPGAYSGGTTTAAATTLQDYLRGARSGFKNGWIEARSESGTPDVNEGASPAEIARSRLLPVNFNVAAFIAALQDCTAGELGSFFPGTCGAGGRRFNGVVWISATWPGALDGFSDVAATSDHPKLWPDQPVDEGDGLHNRELPMPMCAAANRPLKDTSGAVGHSQPCTDPVPFPNFIRLYNAQHIHPPSDRSYAGVTVGAGTLPGGLTIATNLPVAVLGDANLDTTPKLRRTHVPASDHFAPFLVAGDRFHRQSKAWRDGAANWSQSMKDTSTSRLAATTTQHLEILAGWNPTPATPLAGHDHSSDGFEDFPRYNERWNCDGASATANYFGSIVVAFASVYERTGANNDSGHGSNGRYTTCFPRRNEGFDFHLEDPLHQPPGAPLILAQSVGFVAHR